jgi:hypothetical protein
VIPIKGDVSGIERAPGRTEVLVDEGLTQSVYALDEGLIDFGAALEFLVRGRRCGGGSSLPCWQEVRRARAHSQAPTRPLRVPSRPGL